MRTSLPVVLMLVASPAVPCLKEALPPAPARRFSLALNHRGAAWTHIAESIKPTPLLTSRQLGEAAGYDSRLKAAMFQRVAAYSIRGPLKKFAQMPQEHKRRSVDC